MNTDQSCIEEEFVAGNDLAAVVDQLNGQSEVLGREYQNKLEQSLPVSEVVAEIVSEFKFVLFPGFYGKGDLSPTNARFQVSYTLNRVLIALQDQIRRGHCFMCNEEAIKCKKCEHEAVRSSRALILKLPAIKKLLISDIYAAYNGDPAARSPGEVIFSYPGFNAILSYRLAHELYKLDVPIIPRMITEQAHSQTGIDIHPGATIGGSFFIDHGTGVVIGETSVVGNKVSLYQGVTLGAKNFPLDQNNHPQKGLPRHPIIEDDVIIYSGATLLGRITIGKGSVIGGNVWLTHSVSPGMKITQNKPRQEYYAAGAGI
ncbi:serine O-acetyltransferase EpsC [candidate division CSSED10-310 bacterium]|uniref:serine O-acetyltransferase n=1 Tax=candidate division CSSED10-310 bacterium TaxID=2855610 RepID=A0ABV6YYD8_UNCC1